MLVLGRAETLIQSVQRSADDGLPVILFHMTTNIEMGKREIRRMSDRATTARSVERTILMRIASEDYPLHGRLPSCTDLGKELGANKNTVSKAYRTLATLGILDSKPGRGTFVTQTPRAFSSEKALDVVRSFLADAAKQATVMGVTEEEFREVAGDVMRQHFDSHSMRLGYVECNDIEGKALSREFELSLSRPVEYVALDDACSDFGKYRGAYDLLIVNVTHLAELEEAANASGERSDIVSVSVPPDPATLAQVARLRRGTRLGVVCTTVSALEMLTGMIRATNPALDLRTALTGDDLELDAVKTNSDVLLVTKAATARMGAVAPDVMVLEVSFYLDQRAIQTVAEHITSAELVASLSGSPV